jgi:hypothetical protein
LLLKMRSMWSLSFSIFVCDFLGSFVMKWNLSDFSVNFLCHVVSGLLFFLIGLCVFFQLLLRFRYFLKFLIFFIFNFIFIKISFSLFFYFLWVCLLINWNYGVRCNL